ncbi:DsbA family protein [Microcella alkalica]|uniref:Protein-disulfide isomerase n=1 Tax=Microcella alkalica TaxID=355930 RepID=A0A839EAL3_9MICO|nr:thioredoxin domain-containing protein [Microcella alkalica]MBA8848276.1 protein-disulfide isomerase [Microcella alkalica]
MTESRPAGARQSKTARRDEAREKARQLRAGHKKKERRNRWLLQGGIAVVLVAIVAIVALVITNSVRPERSGPRNMASDGILIGEGLAAVQTPGVAPDATPVPSAPNEPGVVAITIWVDYLCPVCGEFEQENGELIRTLVDSGAATVEYHPIAILTTLSAGTQYSLRAANAAACVSNFNPDAFFDFNTAMFTDQPAEGTEGLTDDELLEVARDAGATSTSLERCIDDGRFFEWVKAATTRAGNGPLPVEGTEVENVRGTPTILVNGELYTPSYPFDSTEFSQFVLSAAGDDFAASPSPSPTP